MRAHAQENSVIRHSRLRAALASFETFAAVAVIAIVASPWLAAEDTVHVAQRPNIVIILADDLGYGDVGTYNAQSRIPTPVLDQFARDGIRFTDAHAPASCCSPTRYSLLTGRYAWRSRLKKGVLRPWEPPLIEADRLTLPRFLKDRGYRTAAFGKWHLGFEWPTKDGRPPEIGADLLSNVDFTRPIGGGPLAAGFDTFLGMDTPHSPPYAFIENDRTVGVPDQRAGGFDQGFKLPGPTVAGFKPVDILPRVTEEVVEWIEVSRKSAAPFFLYVALTAPHFPVVPAHEFRGKSGAGDYGDFVCQTDFSIGRILNALERVGAAENSLVIVTSDNGAEVTVKNDVNPGVYDRVRQYGHNSSGILRGAKRDLWEGGHRVPFLVRWPKRIRAGSVCDSLICHVDLTASIATLIDERLPDDSAEDSIDVSDALLGRPSSPPARDSLIHHSASGDFAIRQGPWVYIESATGDDNRIHGGEPDFIKRQRGYLTHSKSAELFNLVDDLQQRRNIIDIHPDIAQRMSLLLRRLQN